MVEINNHDLKIEVESVRVGPGNNAEKTKTTAKAPKY